MGPKRKYDYLIKIISTVTIIKTKKLIIIT